MENGEIPQATVYMPLLLIIIMLMTFISTSQVFRCIKLSFYNLKYSPVVFASFDSYCIWSVCLRMNSVALRANAHDRRMELENSLKVIKIKHVINLYFKLEIVHSTGYHDAIQVVCLDILPVVYIYISHAECVCCVRAYIWCIHVSPSSVSALCCQQRINFFVLFRMNRPKPE